MSDIYSEIKAVKDKTDVLKTNKVAKFAYTDAAYTGDIADGVAAYDFASEQNVPLDTATDLNETVLAKGVRSQAASLPRNSINHFFGRVSYNLNKAMDYLNTLMVSFLRSQSMNGNRYTSTTPYQQYDTCTFVDDSTDTKVRYFVRFSASPAELSGAAPLIGGVINDTHWRELNAPLISPAFTGIPTAPTAVAGTNTTQVATTAFANKAVTDHNAVTNPHSADSAATPSRLVIRDAAGRAKMATPVNNDDIAIKSYVDAVQTALAAHTALTSAGTHGSAVAATANTLIHRDASGRAKVVAPAASDDIALKSTVDDHAALTAPHSAVAEPTASRLVVRDASGRAAFANPVAADDAATKGYVDSFNSVDKDERNLGATVANYTATVANLRIGVITRVLVYCSQRDASEYLRLLLPTGGTYLVLQKYWYAGVSSSPVSCVLNTYQGGDSRALAGGTEILRVASSQANAALTLGAVIVRIS